MIIKIIYTGNFLNNFPSFSPIFSHIVFIQIQYVVKVVQWVS